MAVQQVSSNAWFSGYCFNGRAQFTREDGVTFNFKESRKSTWGTVVYNHDWGHVSAGQLHEIFYIKQ